MKINTNSWNKLRYTLYTPGYDFIARYFKESRKKSIDSLNIKAGDKVLIIGAGTGLDLEFLPPNCHITATDITPSMVDRIKKRNESLKLQVTAIIMDGQALDFKENSFDKVILHLIIAVIPDPIACLKEAERVLKPSGQIALFDKFVPKGQKASLLRRATNQLTNFLFSDITRSFESTVSHTNLVVINDKKADFEGNFRIILMEKQV